MKASKLFIVLGIVFLYSCQHKQENKSTNTSEGVKQDALALLQVTVISTLPDSLQPKTIVLASMPKPLTVAVPSKAGGSYSITNSKGEVTKINLEPPVNKPLAVLQNEKSQTILDAQGKPFIMGDGGISNFTTFTTDNGLALDGIYCSVMDKSGNIWFGTNGGGVSRYDGKAFSSFTTSQGLTNNYVYSILEDKSGNLWFGTLGGGVSRYDGKTFSSFTTAQGLANNYVRSILEDKSGNLWFGTDGGGVSRYDGKRFSSFTTAQGLANDDVFSILEDKSGNLWFGTLGGGVSRYDGKTFSSFSTVQGLADDVVYDIVEDKQGNIVIGTNLGFTLIPVKARSLPFSEIKAELEYFNNPNGYPIKDVNTNAILCDSKGIIWSGTGSDKTGLVRFDYAALHKNTEPPALVIQSVKVKDENICWYNLQSKGLRKNHEDSTTALLQEFVAYGKPLSASENEVILKRFGNIQFDSISKFYPLPQNLVLPYEHNQISFEFAAVETGRPFLVKYQYMLEGYDKEWSPVTNRSNASFGNINEGTYTFRVCFEI